MDASVDDRLQKTRRNFVLALLVGLAILSFLVFRPFLSYVFMGGLIVYLAYPLHRRLARAIRSPAASAALMLLLVFALLVVPLAWIGVEVVTTSVSLVEETSVEEVNQRIRGLAEYVYGLVGLQPPEDLNVEALVGLSLPALQSFIQEAAPGFLAAAGSFAVGFVVMAFVIYYGLVDGPKVIDYVIDMSPLDDDDDRRLLDEIRRVVDAVFLGHIIVSAIQGVLGGIGFLLFGVPNAIFWGFVMIILSLIPILGSFLVWAPAGLYLMATGDFVQGVGLLVWGAVIVGTVDNFLRPKIVGSRADIHPLLVLVGVLGGLVAFGFIGFVLGPLVLSVLVAVLHFWREDYLPRYQPPDTAESAPMEVSAPAPAERPEGAPGPRTPEPVEGESDR